MRISDVHAVVTGAARGLGKHFALQLAGEGAAVAAGDVDRAGLRELAREARELPGRLAVAPLDITDPAQVTTFLDAAGEACDAPDVLINNAGILQDGLLARREGESVRTLPLEQWRRVLDVNLTGQFLMARSFAARLLRDGRSGVVVNVSSLARSGSPGQSSYAASKAALDAATRSWALELAPTGVRVVGVAPGVIETPILDNVAPERLEQLRSEVPLGRFGRMEEVWLAVRFALECEFFTGRVLEVDGGARLA